MTVSRCPRTTVGVVNIINAMNAMFNDVLAFLPSTDAVDSQFQAPIRFSNDGKG